MSKNNSTTVVKTFVKLSNGKVIGYLEDSSFVKPVLGSKHKLRQPPAWAVDAEAFDSQIKGVAVLFRVVDKETGTVYEVSVADFDKHKGEFDRGFGTQYFLPLAWWKIETNGSDGPKQLSLAF